MRLPKQKEKNKIIFIKIKYFLRTIFPKTLKLSELLVKSIISVLHAKALNATLHNVHVHDEAI